jgi:repressor LexA
VQVYVLALEKQGRIQRTKLGNIHLPPKLNKSETVCVPIVGQIACGQPMFAEENILGNVSLPKDIFGNGKLFMLDAHGNSMIEAGINDGDKLVIRQQNTADDGEIVVALVGNDATLKRLYHKGNKIVLHPENKTMQDIVVEECIIQGVLVSCIKMY